MILLDIRSVIWDGLVMNRLSAVCEAVMDQSKYEIAVEAVIGWVEEMMRSGYERKEALETLLHVLKSGALGALHEQVRGYEEEIEAAIKSQLE